jgi:hypothetical protein
MARLPLKPPKLSPPSGVEVGSRAPKRATLDIRMHGGVTAVQDSAGDLLPVRRPPNKRQRQNPRINPGISALPPTMSGESEARPEWPPKSPLVLTDEQLDELGKYIKADSLLLEQSGFDG